MTESGRQFCSKCGTELAAGVKFCRSCGQPVGAGHAERRPSPVAPQKPPKPRPTKPARPGDGDPGRPRQPLSDRLPGWLNRRAVVVGGLAVLLVVGVVVAVLAFTSSGNSDSGTRAQAPANSASNSAGASSSAGTATAARTTTSEDAARSAVISVLQDYAAGYSASDLSKLGDLFATDVERHGLSSGGCSTDSGKSAVLADYQSQFVGNGGVSYDLGLSPDQVTFPGAASAQVQTQYVIQSPHSSGSITFTLVDQGGTWLISKIDATCHPSH